MHGNEGAGISAFDSDLVQIVASTLTDNYGGGVMIAGSADSAVLGSTLRNAGDAVFAHGSRNTLVRGNTIESQQAGGVRLYGSTDGRVEDNTILRTGSDAIGVSGDRNAVTANRIRASSSNGIAVYAGEGNAVGDNTVGDHTGGAFEDGIFVAAEVTDASVSGNRAIGNYDDGIEVRTPSAGITGNTANDNADYGIEAMPGVTDGGGDRAGGNGNPEQCANMSCSSSEASVSGVRVAPAIQPPGRPGRLPAAREDRAAALRGANPRRPGAGGPGAGPPDDRRLAPPPVRRPARAARLDRRARCAGQAPGGR